MQRPSGRNAMAIGHAIAGVPHGREINPAYMFQPQSIKEPTLIWPDKIRRVQRVIDDQHPKHREEFIQRYLAALITT